ncbi:PQQ-dependent sugar dehydrogenase [Aquisalimonas asiatica]|uniref:Glucose/arabinose dehydrogenase, beta-propeller fold n=1 Tax=Aquisalimonas asiatica TaxID=406100 RepID=A0A1H8SMV7_9GAMM|nr:PQQ-dependent sugar dehydrogenase [Aquisalimonas asiatica]SEO80130.1 Glucose/arabinose dehydrogenase, beta-propeller fold [Aquisalimonas asiatica]
MPQTSTARGVFTNALTLAAALAAAGGMASAAAVEVSDETIDDAHDTEEATVTVTRVVSGLEHGWAMDWLPDGRMLVTERPGGMYVVDDDSVTELEGLPEIFSDEDQLTAPEGGSQSGLLDVRVHPQYDDNGWIYLTYSSPGDTDGVATDDEYATGTVLARARLNDDGDALEDLETVYSQAPRHVPGRHYGSRILFAGDGTVLFSIGDRGLRAPSQDLTDPSGSIIRVNEAGGVPDDNPYVGAAPGNLRPEIFSFGHRNNQGLVMHPETGEIWATDHGPSGGDLLYQVEAGNNYGWPQVAFGTEYSTGEQVGIGESAPGVTEPTHVWEESMAPSGLAFYMDGAVSEWDGNLFAGSLVREQLHRLELDGDSVVKDEVILDETVGRIRDVRQGPDGMLYVLTDEADAGVYRIEPAD